MIRRPPRSTQSRSSAASDVYKRQMLIRVTLDRRRHVRHRREAAHTTRVGSHVAIPCALVVARGCERQDSLAITEEQQGTLATPEKLLEQQRTSTTQTL